jgi:hypothetical protein
MAVVAVAIAGAAVACGGSAPPPQDQFGAAQSDVARADEAGAANVPDARLHLQLAREELAKAKGMIGQENDRATTLIARARAEAVVALQMSAQAKAMEGAQQAADAVARARANPTPRN